MSVTQMDASARLRLPVCTASSNGRRMSLTVLADRFVPLARALHLDLATGDRAWLRLEPATPVADGLRWAERCAALTAVWHPGMAECLDFGPIASERRFEAYRVNDLLPRRAGLVFDARRMRERIEEFLIACAVAPGTQAIEGADASGRWLVVPGAYDEALAAHRTRTGSEAADPSRPDPLRTSLDSRRRLPEGTIGVRLVHRLCYDAVRE